MRRLLLLVALVLACTVVPATAQQRGVPTLSLASQTAWTRGDSFTMRLDVDGVRRPEQLQLGVSVHRAVTSRSQFARTLDGELLGNRIHRDDIPFEELRFDTAGAVPVAIDARNLRPGVYPVVVELLDGGDQVTSLVTHLIRTPRDPVEIPLSVAWVQAYGADPALQPDGTVRLGREDLDALRTIAAQLDAGTPLTVVPTPETVAALGVIDADGRTTAALAQLLEGHQVLATPFVDLDVSALVGAGRGADLIRQRVEGDQTLLDALDLDADTRTWSLEGVATRAALRALGELGVRRVILDEEAMTPLVSSVTGGLTLARPFRVEGADGAVLEGVAVDPGLVAHLERHDGVLAAHHLLADLAVLHFDSPGVPRGVAVRPPNDWEPSEEVLSAVLASLASSPLLEPVTVDDLFERVELLTDRDGDPIVRDVAFAEAPSFGLPPSSIDRARDSMEGFASLAGTSNPELAILDRLVLVSETSDLSADDRQRYLDGVANRIRTAAGNVRVLGDRTYRLTAREGTIPLTLVNDNDFGVRVAVRLTSDKLEFTGDRLDDLDLEAKGTTTHAVPVKALTSGAFPLRVTLQSPNGQLELGRSRFTITSTVASGVGVVLSAGAALFLLLWWGSHWRTVRRARRLVDPEYGARSAER